MSATNHQPSVNQIQQQQQQSSTTTTTVAGQQSSQQSSRQLNQTNHQPSINQIQIQQQPQLPTTTTTASQQPSQQLNQTNHQRQLPQQHRLPTNQHQHHRPNQQQQLSCNIGNNDDPFKILQLNCSGLSRKIDEIIQYIAKRGIGMAAIQETKIHQN